MNEQSWSIKINIVPQPKQSTNFNKGGWAYTGSKKESYQSAVRHAIAVSQDLPEAPLEGPLLMHVTFCFPLTSADTKTKKKRQVLEDNGGWIWACSKRNDLDNLMKPVSDALNSLVIVDDGHICSATLTKIKSVRPCIEIKITKFGKVK